MPPPKNVFPFPNISPTAKAKPPGSHGPSKHGSGGNDIDVSDAEINNLSLDLLGLALDLAGIADPTPISDGASALLSIARGNWFDAIVSGASMIPYVGDLAKAGKLPKYLKSVEKAIDIANKSEKVALALMPAFRKLKQGLDLLPFGASKSLDRLRHNIDLFLKSRGAKRVLEIFPDISKRFRFTRTVIDGKEIKKAEGFLGVPGKVKTHRSNVAQRAVSKGSGDDAGHLIGNQFGATGGAENLSLQNWIMNRGKGTWYELEQKWGDLLKRGYKVEVKITDTAKVGGRPYHRKAEWIVTHPNGGTQERHVLDYMNTTSEKSRAAVGEVNPFPPGHKAEVIDMAKWKKDHGK